MNIPKNEKTRFKNMIRGQAQQFGLNEQEYIQKVWYHENASRFGEYIAMALTDELLQLISTNNSQTSTKTSTQL
jgi:hypothetical protein